MEQKARRNRSRQPGGFSGALRQYAGKSMVVLFGYPTDTWEFASGLLAIAWGWGTFRTGHVEAGAVEGYAQVAPIWSWGAMMFILGLTNIAVMYRRAWDKYRAFTSLVLAFMWITLAYNQFMFGYEGGIGEIYTVAALLSVLCTIRLFHFRRKVVQVLKRDKADCQPQDAQG